MGKKKAVTRRDRILKAMWDLGALDRGVTTREVSEKTGFNINGLARTLGRMSYDVDCLGVRGGKTRWRIKNAYAGTLE